MAKTDTKKEDEKQYDTQKKVSPLAVGKEAAVNTNERGVLNMAERLMKKPKYYAEGGETKSSRTKLLEGMPKNFIQEAAAKLSKKLDSVGIKQEKEYQGKTKEEIAVKKAKGGSVESKKQRNRDLGAEVRTLERNYPDNPKDYEPQTLPRDLEQERKMPRHEKGPFKGYSKEIQPLQKGGKVKRSIDGCAIRGKTRASHK